MDTFCSPFVESWIKPFAVRFAARQFEWCTVVELFTKQFEFRRLATGVDQAIGRQVGRI